MHCPFISEYLQLQTLVSGNDVATVNRPINPYILMRKGPVYLLNYKEFTSILLIYRFIVVDRVKVCLKHMFFFFF